MQNPLNDPEPFCDACGGDGGGDYCSGHYGGEPTYQWVKCAVCEGTGKPPPKTSSASGSTVYLDDLDEEIPF